jgi:transposase
METDKFKKLGINGIKDKRKKKPKSRLTRKQCAEIKRVLLSETPRRHGYDCDQWTTGILAELIEEQFNVRYESKTSYYIIFKEATRYSFRKPGFKYRKRNDAAVEKWRVETEPIVRQALEDDNTIVLCGDEMGLSSSTTFQKVWLPLDGAAKIEPSRERHNRSIYGFLDIKTGHQYAFKPEWQNMYESTKILRALRKQIPQKKILLCWDNAGWHRGSGVTKLIAQDGNIKVSWFPPYSHEENPQEHVWKAGQAHITHNKLFTDIDAITDDFVDFLNTTKFTYKMF